MKTFPKTFYFSFLLTYHAWSFTPLLKWSFILRILIRLYGRWLILETVIWNNYQFPRRIRTTVCWTKVQHFEKTYTVWWQQKGNNIHSSQIIREKLIVSAGCCSFKKFHPYDSVNTKRNLIFSEYSPLIYVISCFLIVW